MSPEQKKTVIEQIDRALTEHKALRSKSKYDDCSDQPETAYTSVITMMQATIKRNAPPGSIYHDEGTKLMKQWGATNAVCLKYLPGLLVALRRDVEDGCLQSVTEIIHADIFADFLEMAHYLLGEGYYQAAAVLVGGVLEEHLRKLCLKTGLAILNSGHPIKADRLNADLAAASVYSKLDQKSVTAWLDLRNKAAHGQHTEYTKEQVGLMLEGVRNFAARLPC